MNIYKLIGDRSTPLDANTQEFLFSYHIRAHCLFTAHFSQAIACFESTKCIQPKDWSVDIH
ncbi:MAG: hypothetical protein V7K18_00090 [Nostoc sp.]|uniref:hypothetical protein n=1 Tax=Nostoc sp. TaxID=1180 RepID=UPI002FF847DD